MKTILIILSILITSIGAKNINSKVIKAHDGYRSSSHHHHHHDIIDISLDATSEATSEISTHAIQLSSAISLEASTQATSQPPQQGRIRRRNYSQIKFLQKNRVQITQDISQGRGEHLITLLNMMNIKQDTQTLTKIQSNFEILSALDDEKFLSKLTEIGNL